MPYLLACWLLTTLLLAPSMATAQVIQDWETKQFSFEQVDKDRVRLMREVEVNGTGPNKGQQMFADELLWNTTTGELEAVGNVTLVSPTARLSADRVVFNTKTKLGTFYSASGLASLGDRGADDRSMFGTLEPDVYFYGEIIEKVGEDRYVISKGAFTTCVQPSPRWEIVSTKTTINLEDYAFLRNAVIRVKDVPVFYLPVLYYPIQSDDRATGFLLPTYGSSTIRGQSISNAFFWAIDRSQDLTFLHDWFTSTGQGAGAEYRYVAAPGAEGFFRAYWLDEDESTIDNSGGGSLTTPSARSYELRGDAAQPLPGGFRARARIDYFSSLTTSQLYHTNIYESTRRNRSIAGSVSGNWAGVSLTGNYRRDELFYSTTASTLNGQTPVVSANLSSRRLGLSPFYVAFNSEVGRILYASHAEIDGVEAVDDRSLGASTCRQRCAQRSQHCHFSASTAPSPTDIPTSRRVSTIEGRANRVAGDAALLRFRADITGPVFSKVFTPNNAFADRLKHVIEPNINFQRVTDYDNEDRIPTTAGVYDVVIGGVTRVNYGITNRFLVRKAPKDPKASSAASAPREFLNVAITQSYYTDPRASQFDTSFQSGYGSWRPPSSFSPVALTARANPTASSSGTVRLEYDTKVGTLEAFNATGSTTYRAAQTSIGWSTRRISADARDNSINAQTNLSFLQGRTGGSYLLDWDIARETILQQRWVGFYSAQCCGIVLEYQERNFPSFDPNFPYPKDRRFNLSFTLAGVGTFSNFFGVFGGTTY